jgi:hypothetical protein
MHYLQIIKVNIVRCFVIQALWPAFSTPIYKNITVFWDGYCADIIDAMIFNSSANRIGHVKTAANVFELFPATLRGRQSSIIPAHAVGQAVNSRFRQLGSLVGLVTN